MLTRNVKVTGPTITIHWGIPDTLYQSNSPTRALKYYTWPSIYRTLPEQVKLQNDAIIRDSHLLISPDCLLYLVFFFFFFGPLSIVILAAHFSFTKIQHLSVVIFDFWILSLDAPATWPTLAHLSLQVTRKSPARSSFPLHSTSPHHVANTPKTV